MASAEFGLGGLQGLEFLGLGVMLLNQPFVVFASLFLVVGQFSLQVAQGFAQLGDHIVLFLGQGLISFAFLRCRVQQLTAILWRCWPNAGLTVSFFICVLIASLSAWLAFSSPCSFVISLCSCAICSAAALYADHDPMPTLSLRTPSNSALLSRASRSHRSTL